MKPTKNNILKFLRESNAIEDVWDETSLIQSRRAWEYLMRFDSINNMIVKEVHRMLMKDQPIENRHKGDFRDIPVTIGGQLKAQPKIVIDSLMRDWCSQVNQDIKNKNQSQVQRHVDFENIHPFVDGNGRIGRMLMNWQQERTTGQISIILEANKELYYKWFRSSDE